MLIKKNKSVNPEDKYSKSWVSQPASRLNKSIRNDGKQPRIAIIRGKEKRVRQDEKDAWHPDVDV